MKFLRNLSMQRAILHMDLDSFFVSVERLRDSSLIGKPLIIGGLSDRSVVSSCSYEARAFGVHSAMPMVQARKLCPHAIILGGDMRNYSHYSSLVTQVIATSAPLFEKASIDEFYLDLSGMDRFFGTWKWSLELKQTILKETGLPISFALSSNKTVSKIGTGQSKPNGALHIEFGKEKEFLAPLSLKKIPMIGEKTFQQLKQKGFEFIASVQSTSETDMERLFGNHGIYIWRKANGICTSPVQSFHEQKSISSEHTFEADITDIRYIKDLLTAMSEKLGFSIRKKKKLSGCITVKIRYSDFETQSHQMTIPYTANDNSILKAAHLLFDKLYKPGMKVRLIGLRLSDLVSGSYQLNLFEDKPEIHDLYEALDTIRNKYGLRLIQKANSIGKGRR